MTATVETGVRRALAGRQLALANVFHVTLADLQTSAGGTPTRSSTSATWATRESC
ncbi:MAG TPA: hypothetical protein VK640_13445 [Actinomycetes bacterium]|nr:hypothetical protein [Actinomycetes bacterium]